MKSSDYIIALLSTCDDSHDPAKYHKMQYLIILWIYITLLFEDIITSKGKHGKLDVVFCYIFLIFHVVLNPQTSTEEKEGQLLNSTNLDVNRGALRAPQT